MNQYAILYVSQEGKLTMKVEEANSQKQAITQFITYVESRWSDPQIRSRVRAISNAFPSQWGMGGVNFKQVEIEDYMPNPPFKVTVKSPAIKTPYDLWNE